jgi:hypothetical protein
LHNPTCDGPTILADVIFLVGDNRHLGLQQVQRR